MIVMMMTLMMMAVMVIMKIMMQVADTWWCQARWSWLGLEPLDLAGTNSTGCPASKSKHFQPDLGENTAQC